LGGLTGQQKNSAGYQWFESISVQRRVSYELDPTASAICLPASHAPAPPAAVLARARNLPCAFGFGLGVAAEQQFAAVGGRQVHVDHLMAGSTSPTERTIASRYSTATASSRPNGRICTALAASIGV
jgi:hypothetical protein